MRLLLTSFAFALVFVLFRSGGLSAQNSSVPPEWKEPLEPVGILGNVYYVGTAELGSFLITTPEGHILLDTPLESETELVLSSIGKLGFDPRDIRILLNSQAHLIADGNPENAFVHLTLKLGQGRALEVRRAAGEKLFSALTRSLAALFDRRPLAISFEMRELDRELSFKKNNLYEKLGRK